MKISTLSLFIFALMYSLWATSEPSSTEVRDKFLGYDYKLIKPNSAKSNNKRPLLLVMHGCNQTKMDLIDSMRLEKNAIEKQFFVLAPQQTKMKHVLRCWNFYNKENHGLPTSEKAEINLIVDLVQEIAKTELVDTNRIYLVGFSAGGGLGAALTFCFPNIFKGAALMAAPVFAGKKGLMGMGSYLRKGSKLPPEELVKRAVTCPRAMDDTPHLKNLLIVQGNNDKVIYPVHADQLTNQAKGYFNFFSEQAAPEENHEEVKPPGKYSYKMSKNIWPSKFSLSSFRIKGLGHKVSGGNPKHGTSDSKGINIAAQILKTFQL